MNQTQIETILRVLLAAGGPVSGLLLNAGMQPGVVNNILTIALIVGPPSISAIWGVLRHTDAGNVGWSPKDGDGNGPRPPPRDRLK